MMRQIIRHYKPGQPVTLYDSSLHAICRGILYNDLSRNIPFFSKENLQENLQKVNVFGKLSIVFAALFLMTIIYILAPVQLAKLMAATNTITSHSNIAVFPKATTNPNLVKGNYLVDSQSSVGVTDFRIIVPKINLESGIVPNVDLNSEQSYLDSLKFGVAHANGSYYPGQNGTVYLFAHSTDTIANIARYNAKFFYLNNLSVGDEVDISFNNKMYIYVVNKKQIIDPKDIDIIKQDKASLILQTCWPPGTDWQRLIVFASLKQS